MDSLQLPYREKLTSEQQTKLWKKAMKGCLASRDELILDTITLNLGRIQAGLKPGVDLDDAISEAWLHAQKNLHNWNPDKGTSFRHYMGFAVVLECSGIAARRGYKLVHLPENVCRLVHREHEQITESERSHCDAAVRAMNVRSIDQCEYDPTYSGLEMKCLDEDRRRHVFRNAWRKLSAREKDMVRKFFGVGGSPKLTLAKLGEEHQLSRERIRQVKEKALRKLRKRLERYMDLFDEDDVRSTTETIHTLVPSR